MFQYHTTPPSLQMVGAEGPKNFELNSSTLLEKALKTLPSHCKFEQSFVSFLLFNFLGRLILGTKIFIQQILKYISVYLNTYLTCDTNVTVLLPKLNRAVGLLAKIWLYTIKFLLKTIYYSLFDSHLIYTCQIWGEIKNDLFTMLPPTWKI